MCLHLCLHFCLKIVLIGRLTEGLFAIALRKGLEVSLDKETSFQDRRTLTYTTDQARMMYMSHKEHVSDTQVQDSAEAGTKSNSIDWH